MAKRKKVSENLDEEANSLLQEPRGALMGRRQAIAKAGVITAAGVAGLVIGGAAGYLLKPSTAQTVTETSTVSSTVTASGAGATQTQTVTQTVNQASSSGTPQYTFYMGGGAAQNQPFWSTVAKGFLDASAFFNVKGVYVGPVHPGDPSEMLSAWTSVAALKPDGFSGTFYSTALQAVAKQMLDEGVPVIANNAAFFDNNGNIIPNDPYLTYIGENSIATGIACAEELLAAFKAKFNRAPKRALWVNFEPSANVLAIRYTGFKQVFEAAGTIADTIPSQPDSTKVASDTTAYLNAHSDTECIGTGYIVFSQACYQAVKALGVTDKVLVGAVDVSVDGLQAIQSGQIVGTVWQQPYLQGWYSVLALLQYKQHLFMPGMVDTGSYKVTAQNASPLMADAQAGIA